MLISRVFQVGLYRNLTYVLEADLYLKGVQGTHMSDEHVMKTLVYKLLN